MFGHHIKLKVIKLMTVCRYEYKEKLEQSKDPVDNAVAKLWADVTDRRGWGQEAAMFDEDSCIEIMDKWAEIIRGCMREK